MSFDVDKEAVADFGFYLGAEAGYTLRSSNTSPATRA